MTLRGQSNDGTMTLRGSGWLPSAPRKARGQCRHIRRHPFRQRCIVARADLYRGWGAAIKRIGFKRICGRVPLRENGRHAGPRER